MKMFIWPKLIIILGDSDAKISKKIEGETVVGIHGIDTRYKKGQMLFDFPEARSI